VKEPKLVELKGNSRLALGFFNSLIRRIECTKPLADSGISVTERDNGFSIKLDVNTITFTAITLNVCSNGTPETIVVLSAENIAPLYGPKAIT